MTVTPYLSFFFFNDTATTEIYTLSLHDALPICMHQEDLNVSVQDNVLTLEGKRTFAPVENGQGTYQYSERASGTCCRRSEEHTSELQSRLHLVCRLLLEKKNNHKSV